MFAAIPLIHKLLYGSAVVLILFFAIAWQVEKRAANKWEAQTLKCIKARKADRLAYERAQLDAAAKNREQVARIEAEQRNVTDEVSRNLNARLERLRSELRSKSAAPQGAAGSPKAGPDGPAPGSPDGTARVCLEAEELLRAAENEERHDQLISWIEKQLAIPR